MSRCVIYARYSDPNLQSDRSIDDQVSLCRQRAKELGYTVAEVYTEHGISAAHLINRPALNRLLADAVGGGFDVLLAEDLDRIARSTKDIAGIYEVLNFHNVKIVTLSETEITELHIGFKGTMNALFLRELSRRVKNRQKVQAQSGKVPCGLSYGYDVVREFDDKGKPVHGKRSINKEQAAVIQRIFKEYASGKTTRAIAHNLNEDGILSPTGGVWRASTIAGSRSRGSGILWNQAYVGFIVWGRVSMVKDPSTGKRVSRPNPTKEWVVVEAPDLRIVDDQAWNAVQGVKAQYSHLSAKQHTRPKRLLSGLVKCGICGGNMTLVKGGHYGCNTHREAGNSICTNNRFTKVEKLDHLVLSTIKETLLTPERIKEFIQEFKKHIAMARHKKEKGASSIRKQLSGIEQKISNLLKLAETGSAPASIIERLNALEIERNALSARAAEPETPENVIEFHPALPELYRKKIEDLEASLTKNDGIQREAAEILRAIIAKVVITPGEARGEQHFELHSAIYGLLRLASPAGQSKASEERSKLMVAGGGLEPPTSAL